MGGPTPGVATADAQAVNIVSDRMSSDSTMKNYPRVDKALGPRTPRLLKMKLTALHASTAVASTPLTGAVA